MSRNIGDNTCYFCGGMVESTGEQHSITEAEAGYYFNEYEGMIVSEAECIDCHSEYLRWIARNDLSFRSTFNDEPGPSDLPKFNVRNVKIIEPINNCANCGALHSNTIDCHYFTVYNK